MLTGRATSLNLLPGVLLLLFALPGARAQEGDLASSAGVFVEPAARARPAAATPRERRTPQRTAPRRAHAKPTATNTPTTTTTTTKPPRGRNTPTPPATAESFNAKAEAAIDAGRFDVAVEQSRQALRLKADNPDANYNLGFALYSSGQTADAVEPLRRASQLDAADPDAPFYLGAALAKLGRHAESAAAYEQASRLAPKNAELLSALGG